jgi:asperthecin polyketide synthase
MQRLALVTAYEALEMSGYAPDRTASTCRKRVGTFYGQASDDYRETNAGQQIGTYGIPGGERAFGNGRINYFFNFGGPSFNIDTACSSGLAAVNAACSSLWAGETDMVIAGGLNVITNSDIYCMLSKGHFLSKTGQCKVWDKSADGYCRSDGVGSVVIKKLEDALADNDPIIATIVSGATNHSCEAVSITHPHAGAQKDNYRQVMHTAGVSPLDVSYVELHGTGTQAGDGVESESVASVFAPLTQARQQRLHLGAVKANIGHGEAAAGVTSLIKVLLAFENEEIPRHIGITTEINPIVMQNTKNRNTGLVIEHTKWPRPEKRGRYAIVNSFGAHGGNTTLLLEDAPRKPKVTPESRAAYPITLSAKSKASLKENTKALIHFIDANPDVTLGDLSYTTCARRMHHHTRIATSATNKAQLRSFLESSIEKVGSLRPVPATAPGVAFVFTGQGAFYRGAAAQLLRSFPFFRDQVAQLDKVSLNLGFPSVFATLERTEEANNVSPILSQLAILILEIALLKLWELLGIRPSFVMGHSLGEYAALVAAKVLAPADAIYLVGRRAELVMASCTAGSHVMLSVRASVEEIRNISESHVYEISCMNDLKSTVISGVREEIEVVRSTLEASGIKCMELDLPFAFHTAQLDPILDEFEQTARHITFHPPQIPIISTLLGKCIFDGNTVDAKYLRRASREPVNFLGAMNTARGLGITEEAVWLEVGHHALCSSFVKSHVSDAPIVQSLRKGEDNHVTLTKAMAAMHCEGLPVCWNEYFKPEEHSYNVLRLGAYRWNNKNHWIQYEGTWTLDKGNAQRGGKQAIPSGQSIDSTSVQQIVSQKITDSTVEVTAVTDVKRSDFMNAVLGHTINGIGVVSAVSSPLSCVFLACLPFKISQSGQIWLSLWAHICTSLLPPLMSNLQ